MKKQKILIHLLFSIYTLPIVDAQHIEQNISVSGGMSFLARQDLVYTPFVHAGISRHSYQLQYQRSGNNFQFAEVGFTYNTSQLGESYEMDMDDHVHMILPHEFLHIHLAYGFGKPIETEKTYQSWVGCAIQSDLQAGYYNFALSTMFGYFINQSVQAWYRRAYTFNEKHSLALHASIPIVSWMARPPYLAEDDEFIENISSHNNSKIIMAFIGDGQLVTWNRLQRLKLSATYQYPLTTRVHVGAEYRFDFIHTSLPKTLLSYQQHISIRTTFKF